MLAILCLMFAYVVLLFADDFTAVQASALAAATVLSLVITQLLKRAMSMSGGAALVLAGVIAAVLTIGAMFATGQARNIGDIFVNVAGVFGVTQAVFRVVVYMMRPPEVGK